MALLDEILLSEISIRNWETLAKVKILELLEKGIIINPSEIKDEEARLKENGILEIFIELPDGCGNVSMEINHNHWKWKGEKLN